MRSILEKSIVHLLNGDTDKAEALFHKFMVERARAIHESLRQDEDLDLSEGWDDEIHEEEYFGGDDLASDEEGDSDVGAGDVDGANDVEGLEDNGDVVDDADGGDVLDDEGEGDDLEGDEFDMGAEGEDAESEGIEGKLDDIEGKIEELTAEFDRLMSEFRDEGDGEFAGNDDLESENEFGTEGEGDDLEGDEFEGEGEEPEMEDGEEDDLADRMEDDLGDEEKPESETMESVDSDGDEDALEEDLADITESIVAELEKISLPDHTQGKGIGSGGYDVKGATNTDGVLPKHSANDRISQAKPYMVKGGNNDSFALEPAPPRKSVGTMVSKTRKGNVRDSYKDTMTGVKRDGDGAAMLNHDFAGGGESKGQSPVSGKMKPRTR